MPVILNIALFYCTLQNMLFSLKLGNAVHRLPLKRRVGFGYETGCAHRYGKPAGTLLLGHLKILVADQCGKACNALYIIVRFRGKSHHKVKLYAVISAGKRGECRGGYILLRYIFVYHVPKALCACLGGEGKSAFLYFLHKGKRKIIYTKGRQRKIYMPRLCHVN